MPPSVPELGESVQQQDQGSVGRPGSGYVQADAVDRDRTMVNRRERVTCFR
jgi:hypothetical protein